MKLSLQHALTSIMLLLSCIRLTKASVLQHQPFLSKQEAKSFLTQSGSRPGRIMTSTLGMRSDVNSGWEYIRELEAQTKQMTRKEHLELAVLHSHLPSHEKAAILDKLAIGSLIGLGNLAERLVHHRTKTFNVIV